MGVSSVPLGWFTAVHYCSITKEQSECPIVIAVGPSEIGKTMALGLTAALSITGLHIVSYGIKFGT